MLNNGSIENNYPNRLNTSLSKKIGIDDYPQLSLGNQRSSLNFQKAQSSFSHPDKDQTPNQTPKSKPRRKTLVMQQQKLLFNSTFISSTA